MRRWGERLAVCWLAYMRFFGIDDIFVQEVIVNTNWPNGGIRLKRVIKMEMGVLCSIFL